MSYIFEYELFFIEQFKYNPNELNKMVFMEFSVLAQRLIHNINEREKEKQQLQKSQTNTIRHK